MRRLFRPMLGAFLVSAACAAVIAQPPAGTPPTAPVVPPVVAPAPAAKDTPAAAGKANYFPNKKGTKWVYKVAENAIDVVSDVGGKLDTMVGGKPVASEMIEVKDDGIYRTKVNNVPIEPPVKIMAFPADKDASWTVDSKLNGQIIKGKFTQKAVKENATVPAVVTQPRIPVFVGHHSQPEIFWTITTKSSCAISNRARRPRPVLSHRYLAIAGSRVCACWRARL